jgi:hypothetical protein
VPARRRGATEVDARPGVVRVIFRQQRGRANGLNAEELEDRLKSTPLVSQWTQHAEWLPARAKVAVQAPFSGWPTIQPEERRPRWSAVGYACACQGASSLPRERLPPVFQRGRQGWGFGSNLCRQNGYNSPTSTTRTGPRSTRGCN